MQKNSVVIVGAGMAGCYLALLLAQKGYRVELIEKRDSLSSLLKNGGRSFNLTLYFRGIQALKKLSLWNEVKQFAEIAEGNVAHLPDKIRFDKFDNHQEVLYTIHRSSLNKTLLQKAQNHPLITVSFDCEVSSLNKDSYSLRIVNSKTGKVKEKRYTFLVGADGAYSTIRTFLQDGTESSHHLFHSDWGYKEVWISPKKASGMNLRRKATHTWPRDNSLLLAFPNPDKSLTLMFNLPINGEGSFSTLKTRKDITMYIQNNFPELSVLIPEISHAFLHKPLGHFTTVKTTPWFYHDSIVLIGDAAHAVLPFYGQGMCAAFEDCISLVKQLGKHKTERRKAFSEYEKERKPNTDLLADLSLHNFIELRDKSRSEFFVVKDKIYTLLHDLFPTLWLPPLYVLIAHGSMSYKEAVKKFSSQEKKAKFIGIHVLAAGIVLLLKLQKMPKYFLQSGKRLTFLKRNLLSYPIR